jgi:hypothetical protein
MAGIGWAPLGGEWWTWQWCWCLQLAPGQDCRGDEISSLRCIPQSLLHWFWVSRALCSPTALDHSTQADLPSLLHSPDPLNCPCWLHCRWPLIQSPAARHGDAADAELHGSAARWGRRQPAVPPQRLGHPQSAAAGGQPAAAELPPAHAGGERRQRRAGGAPTAAAACLWPVRCQAAACALRWQAGDMQQLD